MQRLTVALGQIDIRAGDPRANADRIIAEIVRAKERAVDVIVFPELAVPGYLVGDMPEQESFVREVWHHNERIVAATAGLDVVVIFGTYAIDRADAKGKDGRIRKLNAGIVVHRGAVLKNRAGLPFFAKTLLPTYRMFDDERHFFSLRDLADERQVPLRDVLAPFDITLGGSTYRIGAMVCEDMWDQDYVHKPMR
jgi:NAD+ synthase (glutamine-hydrolysing)